ncbi:SURF1 family-domain-containing protein [Pelagophyceae sp. CCMP2097]|nr:SURF1 family-domain-containing protein [Pelagophyceae sp. CCMP2097]|mmetsp:Transcript_16889/g.57136  ORF Transcript_16889/g.57136 Transcript_16889/m.57136 type:complete len:284 (-) Transcript_16889:89-940(-)
MSKVSTASVALFGGLIGGTFGMGCWQAHRYQWKIDVMKTLSESLRAPGMAVPKLATTATLLAERPELFDKTRMVRVEGQFDASRRILLGPRAAPIWDESQRPQGLSTSPQGYFVYEVLSRSDKTGPGTDVIVSRGWCPREVAVPAVPAGARANVTGVLVHGEKKATFVPDNDRAPEGTLLWLDAAALRAKLNCGPDAVLVEAIDAVDVTLANGKKEDAVWPKCKSIAVYEIPHVTPQTHLVYSFTWFLLSACGMAMTRHIFFPKAATPAMLARARAKAMHKAQ